MDKTCVIVGAGHGGVACAFSLRQCGWKGTITLVDSSPELPYHKPPLSKGYLTQDTTVEHLYDEKSYHQNAIELCLGKQVVGIDSKKNTVTLNDDTLICYDYLILALGANALIPPIDGIAKSQGIFTLRTLEDANKIRQYTDTNNYSIVIIGGGYIGLEMAASLRKKGQTVTLLEREARVLARVTSEATSTFFKELHTQNGVTILTNKNVTKITSKNDLQTVHCSDGTSYQAKMIVVGTGASPEIGLAKNIGLKLDNGIFVDEQCRTSVENIFAIGDCTSFFHPRYKKTLRLESVQNAKDQGKVVAKTLTGEHTTYDALPWFWSDQYDVKLQIAGLSVDYDIVVSRKEIEKGYSVWYLKNDVLVCIDAMNHPRAYMLGTKLINEGVLLDPVKIQDSTIKLSATAFLK